MPTTFDFIALWFVFVTVIVYLPFFFCFALFFCSPADLLCGLWSRCVACSFKAFRHLTNDDHGDDGDAHTWRDADDCFGEREWKSHNIIDGLVVAWWNNFTFHSLIVFYACTHVFFFIPVTGDKIGTGTIMRKFLASAIESVKWFNIKSCWKYKTRSRWFEPITRNKSFLNNPPRHTFTKQLFDICTENCHSIFSELYESILAVLMSFDPFWDC